ncbi:MAG: choice-of-anchor M domain-containing protein [Verrucomicrobiota bacterium]
MKRKLTIAAIAASAVATSSVLQAQQIWTAGHGDIGLEYDPIEGELEPHWHLGEDNETVVIDGISQNFGSEGTEFEADELIAEGDRSETRNPTSDWDFLGVNSGETFWVFPQTEDPSVPYIGIGTEELDPSDWDGNLTLTLIGFSGPGAFSLYSVDGIGVPTALMATSDGIDSGDVLSIAADSHEHFNWGFSALGDYELTFQAEGTLSGGGTVTGSETFGFTVVPEPSSFGFILAAAGLLCAFSRRRRG